MNEVVVDRVSLGKFGLGLRIGLLAKPHAAGAQIVDIVASDPIVLAAKPQPSAVRSEMRDLTALDHAATRPNCFNRCGNITGGLRGSVSCGRNFPVGVDQL